jgi:hypothetical protein
VSLINTSHPLATGGTFSNVLATAADLKRNFVRTIIDRHLQGFVDERGLKIAAFKVLK